MSLSLYVVWIYLALISYYISGKNSNLTTNIMEVFYYLSLSSIGLINALTYWWNVTNGFSNFSLEEINLSEGDLFSGVSIKKFANQELLISKSYDSSDGTV
jgi:hypothetical protein